MTIDDLVRFEHLLKEKESKLRAVHRVSAARQVAILIYQLQRTRPILAEQDHDAPLALAPSTMLPDAETPGYPPKRPRKGGGSAA